MPHQTSLKMNELILAALPIAVPVLFMSVVLRLSRTPMLVKITGADSRLLHRLKQSGVRWFTPEELAIQYIDDARLRGIVDRGYTDGRSALLAQTLRWYTPAGSAARQAVHDAIQKASLAAKAEAERLFRSGNPQHVQTDVDFGQVTFTYEGANYLVHDLQTLVSTGHTLSGQANLIGITLEDLPIHSVRLRNACFARATFARCSIGNTTFSNCSLVNTTFDTCRLAQIAFDRTTVNTADFSNSYMNMLRFDDTIMPGSVTFKRISYVQLLKFMWGCVNNKDARYFTEKDWLDPVYIDVHGLTRHDNAAFRDYALWCESNLGRFRSTMASEKRIPLYPVVVAITTKFWSSFIALFSTIAVLISSFSLCYVLTRTQFAVGDKSTACTWFDLVEYSFKTFVNAGFSDVKPLKPIARLLTMTEAMLGYLSLGALIFLLNKRIELMRSN
ncbi:Pentapeptide repeat-containing protein [Burkholderia sp. D7]|nr:Pentapeptide repeat-containing protein [Burkholderia sp. D7]